VAFVCFSIEIVILRNNGIGVHRKIYGISLKFSAKYDLFGDFIQDVGVIQTLPTLDIKNSIGKT
jgi:hypothetical protein